MKKIFLLVLIASSLSTYSQNKTLTTVNTVKPKKGQKMAFEAAYKVHVAKFHQAGDGMMVYEIMSGPHQGKYHIAGAYKAFEDFDKERPDAAAHNLDLDKTFFPYLEETENATFRYVDSLSIQPKVGEGAEKFLVTVRQLKMSANQSNMRREMARSSKVISNMNTGFWDNLSVAAFDMIWDGSVQTIVEIRNLKDGFKSLENNFYGTNPPGTPSFRDEYVKLYSHNDWDTRVKDLDGMNEKVETYIMRLRKDLSSPPAPAK
jgi:hypothetical protein